MKRAWMGGGSILLTGATGALGSILLPKLLANEYQVVCLVRASTSQGAWERVKAIIGPRRNNVTVLQGDIGKPNCGISEEDCHRLAGRIGWILNCAGEISFDNKEATRAANVDGVRHLLQLAEKIQIGHFDHVSTAYVAGNATIFSEWDTPSIITHQPRNCYEETKQIGEKMVRQWALLRDVRRFTIYRPSVLVGRSDGSTSAFNGFHGFFKSIDRIAEAVRQRGHKYLPEDIRFEANKWVYVPLVILMEDMGVNCVPIDWVADMMVDLFNVQSFGETYHLIHPRPLRMREGLRWSLDALKVRGIRIVSTVADKRAALSEQSHLLRGLQRRMDTIHDAYVPYCTSEPHFEMERTPQILGYRFRQPPEIDRDFVERMISYGMRNNWGDGKRK